MCSIPQVRPKAIVHTLHRPYYDYDIHILTICIREDSELKSYGLTYRKFLLKRVYNTSVLLENRRHVCDTKMEL
jgi:hypothetical protein